MTFLEPFLFAHSLPDISTFENTSDQNPEDTDWQSASMCGMKVAPKLDYPLYVPGRWRVEWCCGGTEEVTSVSIVAALWRPKLEVE